MIASAWARLLLACGKSKDAVVGAYRAADSRLYRIEAAIRPWLRARAREVADWKPQPMGVYGSFAQAIVPALVALIAVYWGLSQWRDNNVFELEKRWSSPIMQDRRERFNAALICKLSPHIINGDPSSKEQLRNWYSEVIYPDGDYVGIDGDLSAYLSFFGSVNRCITTGSCSEEKTCEMFAGDAEALSHIYEPNLKSIPLITASAFGGEFEALLKTCKPYRRAPSKFAYSDEEMALFDEIRDAFRNGTGTGPNYPQKQRDAACAAMTGNRAATRRADAAAEADHD